MITSVDKALISVVMGVLFLLNTYAGIDLGITEETVSTVIVGLTPILVYLIPNKTKPYVTYRKAGRGL